MTILPHDLQNGPGNFVDHNKYMDQWLWLFAMMKGSQITGGGFESWIAGTSFTNPADGTTLADSWTLQKGGTSAATADVAREATIIDKGSYAMKVSISVGGSSNSYLRVKQSIDDYTRLASFTMTFGVRVRSSTANKVRLSITDGVTTAYSTYHTGSGGFELLEVTLTMSALGSISELTTKIEITSDFTGDIYVDSAFLYITDPGMSSDARAALVYQTIDERTAFAANFIDLNPQASDPTLKAGRVWFSTDGQVYISKDGTTKSIMG